jgi:hypothetical protein
MAQRVAAILAARPGHGRPPLVATFHATCARVLRSEIHHLGYPRSFVIYDEDDRSPVRECQGARARRAGLPSAGLPHLREELARPEEAAARGPRKADGAV